MNMIRFENPAFLYLLLLIPVMLLIFILSEHLRKKALNRFSSVALMKVLMPGTSVWRKWFRFILWQLSFIFLIIAMANPQTGAKMEEVKRKGIDLFIALDISNSMLAEDIVPNRLERSKQAISRLLDKLEGDRIGMIVFAGRAYVQLPITTDYHAARMFLSTVNPTVIPAQGTAIGEAIRLAINSFDQNDHNKAIIIISDGEDHEENALEAAEEASEAEIRVYTIGMGLPDGAPIPVQNEFGKRIGFRKDRSGNTVVTRLNEPMLQEIALKAKGSYTRANNTRSGLEFIFDEINKIEKAEIEARIFTDYDDRFQIFLAASLFLLLVEILIAQKKARWETRIDLFSRKNNNP
jgi:Ca-activated chloride channel homolog